MNRTGMTDAAELLREHGIKPSHQRVLVLSYLMTHPEHPAADAIYRSLLPEMASLSKMTVYNTLEILRKAGLVRIVRIGDPEARYDVMTDDHGHFKCEICGGLSDFAVDMRPLVSDGLAGYEIRERNVYFKGICPGCLENKTE